MMIFFLNQVDKKDNFNSQVDIIYNYLINNPSTVHLHAWRCHSHVHSDKLAYSGGILISAITCQLSMSTCQIINDLSNPYDYLKVIFSDNYVVLSDNDVDLIVDLLDITGKLLYLELVRTE